MLVHELQEVRSTEPEFVLAQTGNLHVDDIVVIISHRTIRTV